MDYYTGNCHDSIAAQNQIKANFKKYLDKFLQMSGQGTCNNPHNSIQCKAENIKLKCGAIQTGNKRSTRVNYPYFC